MAGRLAGAEPHAAGTNAEARFPARPGDHACSRFALSSDRLRLVLALIRDALRRDHKIVYLCDGQDPATFAAALATMDDNIAPSVSRGQMEVRAADPAYLPDGRFEVERMLLHLQDAEVIARAEGYVSLSIVSEMSWVLSEPPGHQHVGDFERRLTSDMHETKAIALGQYDRTRFEPSAMRRIAAMHAVDFAPELASIGREGQISAACAGPQRTLRLAGELDSACAPAIADVIDAYFHGPLLIDLLDITAADARGLSALRGHLHQTLTVVAASEPVRQLATVVGWDSNPSVTICDPVA
ncbi:MAG: hypothetical protein QOD83_903 [Solirubrobacteraceae bacterium]|nr:hypothetical protein [Solirubrobacteraceae bacterium]